MSVAYENPRLRNRPEFVELPEPLFVIDVPEMVETTWVDTLSFDAVAVVDGLTWFRVHLGFGGRGDREDWVAAVPRQSLSVSGWDLEREGGDLTAAMRARVDRALRDQPGKIEQARRALANEEARLTLLQAAVDGREAT